MLSFMSHVVQLNDNANEQALICGSSYQHMKLVYIFAIFVCIPRPANVLYRIFIIFDASFLHRFMHLLVLWVLCRHSELSQKLNFFLKIHLFMSVSMLELWCWSEMRLSNWEYNVFKENSCWVAKVVYCLTLPNSSAIVSVQCRIFCSKTCGKHWWQFWNFLVMLWVKKENFLFYLQSIIKEKK